MDSGIAGRLAAANGPPDLAGLVKGAGNPAAARKVAQQFGALLMENVMRQGDGKALPMASGSGSDIVNTMFAGTVSKSVMAHEKLGLTDLILKSIEKKQQQANAASGDASAAVSAAGPKNTAVGNSLPLAAYWAGQRDAAARGGSCCNRGRGCRGNAHRRFDDGDDGPHEPAPGDQLWRGREYHALPAYEPGGWALDQFSVECRPRLRHGEGGRDRRLFAKADAAARAGQQLGVSPKILLAQAAT